MSYRGRGSSSGCLSSDPALEGCCELDLLITPRLRKYKFEELYPPQACDCSYFDHETGCEVQSPFPLKDRETKS